VRLTNDAGQRYRALVLLAMFSSLRWGELGALRQCDIDPAACTVRVTRQLAEVPRRRGSPARPSPRLACVSCRSPRSSFRWHLSCFAQPGDEGLVFTSPEGKPLHHTNFRRRVWLKALSAAELGDLHFP
jgi:integrase